MIRKPGKLPREVARQEYACKYGTGVLEVHQRDISPDSRVLLVDDVLATCGTALAITELIHNIGSRVIGVAALYCLDYLPKATMPEGCELRAAVHYETAPEPYAI